MYLKRTFLTLISFWICFSLFSQDIDFNNYSPLVSQGDIPDDFLLLGSAIYEKELSEFKKAENRFDRKSQKRFILASSFMINEILQSGRIIFNDPVSQYVNKVADNLLKHNPELRDEIRIYLTKSPSVNAFSTDEGIIFINVGIIAQLSNEAELAYIIAHEIVHYMEKHNMDLFVETQRIFKGKNSYRYLTLDDKYLASSYRSKDAENEADEKGLVEFYEKSGYSLDAVMGVFDVLQYSYLPFDEIVFEKSFFETDHIIFPDDWFPEEINPIKFDDNYDDLKSTHPNIRKRKEALRRILNNIEEKERLEFIQPEDKFLEVRNIARFEAIRQQVLLHEYGDAIYNSFILLKEFPDNRFLQRSIASSLYGLTKFKLYARLRDVLPYEERVEGQSYILYNFLNQMKSKEWNVLTLNYCWKLHKKYPDDVYLDKVCKDLFKDLVNTSNLSSYDFSRKSKEERKKEFDEEKEKEEKKSTKYSRIKKQREKESFKDDEWLTYAFVDLFTDKEFEDAFSTAVSEEDDEEEVVEVVDYLEEVVQYVEEVVIEEDVYSDYNEFEEELKAERKKERYERKHGKAFGISRIVLIDPLYLKVDQRKKENVMYLDSEKSLQDLYDHLNFCAAKADVDLELLSAKEMTSDDTEKFNDLSLIREWMSERFKNEDTEMVLADYDVIQKIGDKYEADYMAWTGVLQLKDREDNLANQFCLSVFMPIIIPYLIFQALTPDINTYFYFVLLDINTGEIKFTVDESFKSRAESDYVKSKIYDIFYQIRKEPKDEE